MLRALKVWWFGKLIEQANKRKSQAIEDQLNAIELEEDCTQRIKELNLLIILEQNK